MVGKLQHQPHAASDDVAVLNSRNGWPASQAMSGAIFRVQPDDVVDRGKPTGEKKRNAMQMKSIVTMTVLFGLLPVVPAGAQIAADEKEFQQLAAALKANDAELQAAITTCITQGIGDNPAAAAKFMGVPVDRAAEAWCTRMTNGIANGKLTLADVQALNKGMVSAGARKVLMTVLEGK